MAKKAPDPPPPPDPYKTAAAQQAVNLSTALANAALNQYEEVTPYGRTYYEPTGEVRRFGSGGEYSGTGYGGGFNFFDLNRDGRISAGERFGGALGAMFGQGSWGGGGTPGLGSFSIPVMRRITEFSPEQQRIFDAQMDTTGDLYDLANAYTARVAEGLQNPFTYEGLPGTPDIPRVDFGANEAVRQQVIDSLYSQQKSRLDPDWEKQRQNLVQNLANRGITVGSDAWKAEMDRFGRGRNDAYNTALNSAIAAGGNEQSRLFGLQSQLYNLFSQQYGMDVAARQRAIQERAYLRDRPINEIAAITAGRGLQMPNFAPIPHTGMNAVDLAGLINTNYNQQVAAAQQAAQMQNSLLGSVGGALGGIFGLIGSDARLKTDIADTGFSVGGVPVKTWRWKATGRPDIGVIAQDVERLRPDAAGMFPNGVKGVYYGKLLGLRAE